MGGPIHDRRRGKRAACAVLACALIATTVSALGADAGAETIDATFTSTDGEGRYVTPGRSCDDGGVGAYWHYGYTSTLDAGVFGARPAEGATHLALASDTQRFPNTSGAYEPGAPTAYLTGVESYASFLNDRGSVKVRLSSGDCDEPTLVFDGSHATGAGTWEVARGTGAFRDAVGAGTFTLDAEVNPGADNALRLDLLGTIDIPRPAVLVEVIGSYWGGLGTDYLSRRPTVVFRVTNVGEGDAYGARVTGISTPSPHVSQLGSNQRDLGDLPVGASRVFTKRFQFDLLGPCTLVILNCQFAVTIDTDLPDAFDAPLLESSTVLAKSPTLPPPL